MEWGGGPVSVCCGVGVTREEGRFPEQETSRTCYRQCAVDLDLHSVFPSNNFLASTYWPHFTDLAESAASPRTPGRALRLGLLDAEGSVPSMLFTLLPHLIAHLCSVKETNIQTLIGWLF